MKMTMRMAWVVMGGAALALTGCAGFNGATKAPTSVTVGHLKGVAHGGQNPISGALIQLYQAGSTGYGVGATSLIPTGSYYLGGGSGCVASSTQTCYPNVYTDGNGYFNITGLYSCTAGTQVYLTATGGNTGSGTNNSSMIMAGLGLCDNVPSIPFLNVNEITTVGAVWALAPFMNDTYSASSQTGYINIGAPSTNQLGLTQAFADINTLVDYGLGSSPGFAAPAGSTVPSQEINAIANALGACVNSSGSGPACSQMFSYTTVNGTAPTDVVGAAINMAKYPGQNAANILELTATVPPFATTFNPAAATDLTLSVTLTGGGLSSPSAIAIDGSGYVWIANAGNNSVTELTNTGVAVSGSSGYTAGSISSPSAIAVDTLGNVWVANQGSGSPSLTELSSTGANMGSSPYTGGGLSSPTAISFDGLGNVWVANSGNSSVSEFSSSGTAMSPTSGYTVSGLNSPIGVAVNTQ